MIDFVVRAEVTTGVNRSARRVMPAPVPVKQKQHTEKQEVKGTWVLPH